jgi:2-phosphosulfolactate phosphatase
MEGTPSSTSSTTPGLPKSQVSGFGFPVYKGHFMKIDVVLSPPEIDLLSKRDLSGITAVVFDVLRATSSMVTALANGAEEIYPVCTIEEALRLKEAMPGAMLGGERHGDRIEGFDVGNSPLEYLSPKKQIITTTTNGTIALKACENAQEVFVGALLNAEALRRIIRVRQPGHLLLICAGTFRDLALEDVFAAGMLCAGFPEADLTDAAQVALALYRQHEHDVAGLLQTTQNGRVLKAASREDDVRWCGKVSAYEAVGVLKNGAVRRLAEVL